MLKIKMAVKGSGLCHVEKNLRALEKFPRVALNNIRDFPEAFKPVCLKVFLFHTPKLSKFLYIPCYSSVCIYLTIYKLCMGDFKNSHKQQFLF